MGDFNSEINETCMQSFCESYGLKLLIKEVLSRQLHVQSKQ